MACIILSWETIVKRYVIVGDDYEFLPKTQPWLLIDLPAKASPLV